MQISMDLHVPGAQVAGGFRYSKCIVGLEKLEKHQKKGKFLCDLCLPFPCVPKWAVDGSARITNTCPIDGYLTMLIFANEKNKNFARFLKKLEKYLYGNYRNLPTGDTFSRACRAFITGNDNVDTLKVEFVKALFAPDVSI